MEKYQDKTLPSVHIKNISHHFFANEDKISVIHDVSFDVLKGERIAIVGPSGCGKTTLLNIINKLTVPSQGKITFFGKDMSRVFQSPALFPWLTLQENIELPFVLRKKIRLGKKRVANIIQKVMLSGFENKYPKELSGGMQSRAALARALVTEPELLLFDEPFASLDEITALKIMFELLKLFEDTKPTIIFVTHTLMQAVLFADRVIVLSARPARIIVDMKISLGYPRTRASFRTEEFQKIENSLRAVISNEFLCV